MEDTTVVTPQQAVTVDRFHYTANVRKDGSCYVWRRNGATKTWKTRPGHFSIPVKYGLYNYGHITHENAHEYVPESQCPTCQATEIVQSLARKG